MAEYDTFVATLEELSIGSEIDIMIRDRDTFQSRAVRAIIFSQESQESGENLWVMSPLGVLKDNKPWKIKILQELDEDELKDNRFHKCESFGKGK